MNLWQLVGDDVDLEPWGLLVGAVFVIDEVKPIATGFIGLPGGGDEAGIFGIWQERDDVLRVSKKLSIRHGFVELQPIGQGAILEQGHGEGILHVTRLLA